MIIKPFHLITVFLNINIWRYRVIHSNINPVLAILLIRSFSHNVVSSTAFAWAVLFTLHTNTDYSSQFYSFFATQEPQISKQRNPLLIPNYGAVFTFLEIIPASHPWLPSSCPRFRRSIAIKVAHNFLVYCVKHLQ